MLTSNKEDYLKIIYEEGGFENPVTNKVIAEKLGVAPPSVSEMIVKLDKQGLITYEAYKGSQLTKAGLDACIELIRSHRLWEVFLTSHLGYSLRESHEYAHLLEHISDSLLIDRLNHYLEYPEVCPHGFVIPQKGQGPNKINNNHKKLSQVSPHDIVKIVCVFEDGALLDYLEQSGVEIGKTIEVVHVADYEGPITFNQDNREIVLSYKAATQVFVV